MNNERALEYALDHDGCRGRRPLTRTAVRRADRAMRAVLEELAHQSGKRRRPVGGLIDDLQEHAEWAREAARWAVVFAMLLDAHGAPVRTEDEGPTLPGKRHGKARPGRPWGVRRVSLTEGAVARPGGHSDGGETEIDQRIAVEVRVRGHLKRQRYGEGREQVRWIYVESYEARRWLSPRPQTVVVS